MTSVQHMATAAREKGRVGDKSVVDRLMIRAEWPIPFKSILTFPPSTSSPMIRHAAVCIVFV